VKKKNKTFVLVGWKAPDLPKHDIWPIFSDNEKKGLTIICHFNEFVKSHFTDGLHM
jgi:hypothetical protein